MPTTPEFARSPNSHFLNGGLRREVPWQRQGGNSISSLARPLLSDNIFMQNISDVQFHGYPIHPSAMMATHATAVGRGAAGPMLAGLGCDLDDPQGSGVASKRARKEKREKKTPTSTAPKRGEYRCGKCGFFPKKQKHNCASEKQKRPLAMDSKAALAAPFAMDMSMMSMLPQGYFS